MTKIIVAVVLFVVVSVASYGTVVTDRVALDAKLCRPAPSEFLQSLPPGLRDGGHYTHICPVIWKNQNIALYILTPRIDLMSKDFEFVGNLINNGRGISYICLIL